MKPFLHELRTALLLTVVLGIVVCGLYPLAVWAGGQFLFPAKANGSLLVDTDGTVRGSTLLGQQFTSGKYFHPRPSAAGTGYDATASSGTNLGPTSKKLSDAITAAIASYRAENNLAPNVPVPADAVTSSASGLDPHISVANVQIQAARVSRARGLPLSKLETLIAAATEGPDLGILGEPAVNVLRLNRALDAASPSKQESSKPVSL